MRPHTRTQCQESGSNQCEECREDQSTASTAAYHGSASATAAQADQEGGGPNGQNAGNGTQANANASTLGGNNGSGMNASAKDTDSLFAIPSSASMRFRHRSSMASNMSSVSAAANASNPNRAILLVELPAEILVKILSYLSFNEVSKLRMVSYDCCYL